MADTAAFLTRLPTNVGDDLLGFVPESILIGTILLLLGLRMSETAPRFLLRFVASAGSLLSLGLAITDWSDLATARPLFTGLTVLDGLSAYARVFLLGTLTLTIGLCLLTGIPDRDDAADMFTLLIGATLGMLLMASAQHLLMVFIAIEMASLPSYALAGFLKGRKQGSEAALKYVVFGASASGAMLYGISLVTLRFGTGYLPDIARAIAVIEVANGRAIDPLVLGGVFLIVVGLAYKLSAVPFHYWCPDVFEGAPTEVAAFLSVASKGAALALTARLGLLLAPACGEYLGVLLAVIGAMTATLGNLAALGQTNLKRLFAYSTIAHAGYMILGVSTLTNPGIAAVLFYLPAYLLMNLGAFAVLAFLRNRTGSEDASACRGLMQTSPGTALAFAVFLVSLIGLPPLAGFAAKFSVFAALADVGSSLRAGGNNRVAAVYFTVLVLAAINTVISAVYYIRLIRLMVLEDPAAQQPKDREEPLLDHVYVGILAILLLALGIAWNPLAHASAVAVMEVAR